MPHLRNRNASVPLALVLFFLASLTVHAQDNWWAGFGKVEITPTEPVRLSGYGSRDKPHTDVADPLFARAMVLTEADSQATQLDAKQTGKRSVVLVSVDSIAVVGTMTRQIEETLNAEYGMTRSDFVICSTHSHAAPHAANGLNNLYRTPLTAEEQAAVDRYADRVREGILKAVASAMASRQSARLEVASSTANFAVNRRVLKNGLWTGFGKQEDGPVDRRVQILRAVTNDGQLLGAAFMYACHCTTLGPDFNKVSADWAGLSAADLERRHAGTVFLPVIGCGADANPEPRTGYDDAWSHATELVSSIEGALKASWTKLQHFPTAHFGYAGLAPERPTRAELEAATSDKDVAKRRWAENMLTTLKKMGRLPETYPAPIHTWSFGKDLLWVFLGGEVVVDYQLRLEKNLDADKVWVAAYTDDVFAYVASERMRAQGGYEVDFSMIYYNQPGRWESGTEDLIERRVKEILADDTPDDKPRTAQQALESIHVPAGYKVDLMAAEPMVDDPVNIAFGHDGRVWVAEMSDYPLGCEGGGRVRWLRDTDGDGSLDQSQVFLSGLNYPSSVTPWRDGAIIITSPAIFFAADRDGDGVAEVREELLQGIAEANPQHRASGFEIGLDGWLNFTSGDNTQELSSTRNKQLTNVTGRDVRWDPDTGAFTLNSGHTQFVRSRDEFNNWFGNVNNQPMFHYVVEDTYRRRAGLSGPPYQHLLSPPIAPPVYPASRTKDRFNDLNTFNRFTSACSSIICRVPGLGEEMRGAALVCEPVHNLVARFKVTTDGSSFTADRYPQDDKFDFFASSDPLCRPVRVVNAPDGSIWVVDMVRLVIEHPQWIPAAWQDRLNLRMGTGLGRIYRVHKDDFKPTALPRTAEMETEKLLEMMKSDNGAARDLAAQQILWRMNDPIQKVHPKVVTTVATLLQQTLEHSSSPAVRAQALGTIAALTPLDTYVLATALSDKDARVRRFAVTLTEPLFAEPKFVGREVQLQNLLDSLDKEQDPGVLLQWTLTLGGARNPSAGKALEKFAAKATSDTWFAKSLALVDTPFVDATLTGLLQAAQHPLDGTDATARAAVEQSINSLWTRASPEKQTQLLASVFGDAKDASPGTAAISPVQLLLLSSVASSDISQLTKDTALKLQIVSAVKSARARLFNTETPESERTRLVPLVTLLPDSPEDALRDIARLLGPQEPSATQQEALAAARRLKADDTATVLLEKWPELLPDVRSSVCSLLLERRNWGEQLVVALEKGAVKPNDLDATVVERLRTYGDRALQTRTARMLGQPPNADRAKVVNELLAKLPTVSDRTRGEKHFVDHCAVCHRGTPEKPIVGAPLENITNWSREQWVVAILDPSRTIEPKYHQYALSTKDGRILSGLIEDRSTHHLTLVAPDGKRHEIELAEIERLKDQGVSLMPEGLETKLDAQAMADLLAYLQTLSARK